MAKDKPRLTRLAEIITQLQSRRLVTATDIARKYDISIRTVYRDIRTLQDSGIPVVTIEGKGYSMMEGYRLPPVMFTEEEANALITVEQIIDQNKDGSLSEQYKNAVTKVKAVLGYLQREKIEILENRLQVRNNPGFEKTSSHLIELQSAVANYRTVRINYVSLQGKSSERTIEPFALYTTKDNWVLIAFCRIREDFRAFRLDRIRSLRIKDEHFEPHEMNLEEYLEKCRKKWEGTSDTPLT